MTVKVREWTKGSKVGFEVDIRFTYPDGSPFRQRIKAPVESKSAAKRWGEARERELLAKPSPKLLREQAAEQKEVPTLEEFGPRFIENYARANRQKASSIDSKERILARLLYPMLGKKKLDAISDEDVQAIKRKLSHCKPKTVNNALSVLSKMLRVAMKWKIIHLVPCSFDLFKVNNVLPKFYEFDEYARLVEAAAKIDARTQIVVLLGGDAGLRRGEMLALRWTDIDFRRGQLVIEQAVWEGKERNEEGASRQRFVDTPKSGRGRIVPMTKALAEALRRFRHLRGDLVLYADNGKPATAIQLKDWLEAAQKRAGFAKATGGLHILRHTFCSHLAMRGAPAKAIQELAGHSDLTTTMRYMHLSPAARENAIRLVDRRGETAPGFGEILERRASETP